MGMNRQNLKPLLFFKKIGTIGAWAGFALLIISFIVSGYPSYFLSGLGFGIIISSFTCFLIGTFLGLLLEYSTISKGKNLVVISSRRISPAMRLKHGNRPELTLVKGARHDQETG